MACSHGVGVFNEGVRVPFGKDLHHPTIKIIDWMIHDWSEAAVGFSMSFFIVVFQSDAEIFVLSAEAYLLWSEHFDVLHGNLGFPVCAAVQFLFFGGETVVVKPTFALGLGGDRGSVRRH